MIAALVVATSLAFQFTPELKQHVQAGLSAKASGDLDTAIREFQRVVELAPDLAAAYVNLGAVYLEKKDYASAIAPLKKSLEPPTTSSWPRLPKITSLPALPSR